MSISMHSAITVPEGAGVTVKRLMPVRGLMNFDPFVLWDHFDIEGGGFPLHPHRGFEAITWMFSGGMQHKDNLGNEGAVQLHTDVEYLEILMPVGSRMQRGINKGWRGIIYVVEGAIEAGGIITKASHALLIEGEVELEVTSQDGARLMWCFGAPHHEPIHQHGPFVD